MTEKIEHKERYLIDPVAFFIALIGGPILFTLCTFWMLLIPVFALAFGGLPYLLVGTPVLLIYLRRHPAEAGGVAFLAACSFLASWLFLTLLMMLSTGASAAEGMFTVLPFGLLFSSCWGASFVWVYGRLARDFYTQPRHL